MREIKFRAWDGEQMHPVEQWQNKSWVAVPIPTDDGNGGVDWHLEQRKIEDIQLMQYTGLKDKNGKEIYEGDVIIWKQAEGGILPPSENSYTCEIKWERNQWVCVDIKPIKDDYHPHYTFASCHMEIIGNIYENSDLLMK